MHFMEPTRAISSNLPNGILSLIKSIASEGEMTLHRAISRLTPTQMDVNFSLQKQCLVEAKKKESVVKVTLNNHEQW